MIVQETKDIELARTEATAIETKARKLEVTDMQTALNANELLIEVKRVAKQVGSEKRKITDPANEVLKAARAMFRPMEDALAHAEEMIKEGLIGFKEELDKEARDLQEKLENDKRITRTDTLMKRLSEIRVLDNQLFGENGSSTFSSRKTVEVFDPELVPKEYWALDMVAIRRDALGVKSRNIAPIEIPGVRVVDTTTLSTNV